MNARSIIRLTASLVIATGLLAAPAVPVTATGTLPTAVATKPKPPPKRKIPDRCWPSFKHDMQRLSRRMDTQIPHYDAHYTSVNSMLDQMVELLSSPDTQELIPAMEAGASAYREKMLPIIAKDRDSAMNFVDGMRKEYKNCFKDKRQDKFLDGMKTIRASYRDLFRAYEKTLGAAGFLTTAQTAKAQEALNAAQLEVITVEDMLEQGLKQLRDLW